MDNAADLPWNAVVGLLIGLIDAMANKAGDRGYGGLVSCWRKALGSLQ